MATHWNACETPLDTAISTLIVFSTSFVINNLYDSWPKLKQKYTYVKRLKWSPHDAHKEEALQTYENKLARARGHSYHTN